MAGPVVLLMVAVMALVVLVCAGRLALAPSRHRPTDRGTDVLHIAMGTAMVAMLLGVLGHRWDVLWVAGFGLAALWFLRSGLVRRSRHTLQHGAGCLAMVAMLVAGSSSYAVSGGSRAGTPPAGPGAMRGMPGMGSMSLAGPGFLTGATLLVLLAGVVLALGAVDVVQIGRGGSAALGDGRPVLAPRCAAACRVAMSLTMGLALLAMI